MELTQVGFNPTGTNYRSLNPTIIFPIVEQSSLAAPPPHDFTQRKYSHDVSSPIKFPSRNKRHSYVSNFNKVKGVDLINRFKNASLLGKQTEFRRSPSD